ncbi:hypothetical protein GCM10027056_14870 [Glaciibacter psychrotolerans]
MPFFATCDTTTGAADAGATTAGEMMMLALISATTSGDLDSNLVRMRDPFVFRRPTAAHPLVYLTAIMQRDVKTL